MLFHLNALMLTWANLAAPADQTKAWKDILPLDPKGKHHAVLYPGLATPAESLALLHLALESKGIVCHEWEQGFNTGITPEVERKAQDQLVCLMRANPGATWHLVGWSLGGLLAREMAKVLDAQGLHVESVATLGTPINSMPDNERVLSIYRMFNKELPEEDVFFQKRLFVSPPCRSMSVYSRQDAVVPWKSCIQSPRHQGYKGQKGTINHEVAPGHLAMVNHPATWTALVQWMGGKHTPTVVVEHQEDAEVETSDYWTRRAA